MGFLNRDLDDVFAFETSKTVLIRDRTLGVAQMVLVCAAWLYILVKPILLDRGYMKIVPPQLHFEFSLRGPCCNYTYNPTSAVFAGNSSICFDTCTPQYYTNTTLMSYCKDSSASNTMKLPCQYFDPNSLLQSTGMEATVLTRIQTTPFIQANCPSTAAFPGATTPNCLPQVNLAGIQNVFTADIESHSLMFRHVVYASIGSTFLSQQSTSMKGKAFDSKGNTVRTWQDNDGRDGDIFTVREILQWANVDLDSTPSTAPGKTKRSEGTIMLVRVKLVPRTGDADGFKYEYTFTELEGEGFNQYASLPDPSSSLPLGAAKYRGIRFIVVPQGEFGKFDFSSLLITITSGLTLMKIAQSLVRTLATMFPGFSCRHLYAAAMTDVTMDFSDMIERRESGTALRKFPPTEDKNLVIPGKLVSTDLMLTPVESTMYLYDVERYRKHYKNAFELSKRKYPKMPLFPETQYLDDAFEGYEKETERIARSRHRHCLQSEYYRTLHVNEGSAQPEPDTPIPHRDMTVNVGYQATKPTESPQFVPVIPFNYDSPAFSRTFSQGALLNSGGAGGSSSNNNNNSSNNNNNNSSNNNNDTQNNQGGNSTGQNSSYFYGFAHDPVATDIPMHPLDQQGHSSFV